MRDIVGKCLVKDASKRPSAAQLLEHKFFKVADDSVLHSMLLLPSLAALLTVCTSDSMIVYSVYRVQGLTSLEV